MKKLTKKEIAFIKDTGWSPTIVQSSYSKAELEAAFLDRSQIEAADISGAYSALAQKYKVNLHKLYQKTCSVNDSDAISLEYDATYLLYLFFSKAELELMEPEYAIEWLKNFKYFFGYRKWDASDVAYCIDEAIDIYNGTRVFYNMGGHVWNIEADAPYILKHKSKILKI